MDLSAVASRAPSLWERLAQREKRAVPPCTSSEAVDRRLTRWQHVVGRGDAVAFDRRLAFGGLTRAEVEVALAHADASVSPPPWMDSFTDIIESVRHYRSEAPAPVTRDRPRPFEHLLWPLAHAARRCLQRRTATPGSPLPGGMLSETACRSLQVGLLDRLTRICAPSLHAQFSEFRPAGYGLLNTMLGATGGASTRYYDAFVERWLSLDLMPLFEAYPVLARLVALVVADWVTYCAEFTGHVLQDSRLIEAHFGLVPGSLGEIAGLRYGLSDPHRHGRCVMRVTFAGGLTLAYKPRSLGVDAAFEGLLGWCGQRGLSLGLKHARSLDRGDHGWMEWLDQHACADREAVARFYRRAGMIIALLHALRATDCHHENVIAHGEHPVLIDLETLMVPDEDDGSDTREATTDETFWQSVARIGMLPRWETQLHAPTPYDISALGGIGPQVAPARIQRWRDINTDGMDVYDEPITLPPRANAVSLGDAVVSPAEHLSDLVEGFREMCQMFLRHRRELVADDGPLAPFRKQFTRYVVRATEQYALILRHGYAPEHLQNGCDRSIELDHVSRCHVAGGEASGVAALLASELRALERLDIPRFTVRADETRIWCDGQEMLSHVLPRDGYSQVLDRIASLSERDLELQIRIIEGSLCAWRSRGGTHVDVIDSPEPAIRDGRRGASSDVPASGDTRVLLQDATDVATMITSAAVENRDGSLSWIGLSHLPRIGRHQLAPVGDGLYHGRCGIALFLAACDRVQDSPTYRMHVERVLQPLRTRLQRDDASRLEKFVRDVGIGIAEGAGGLVYALSCIGEWWHDGWLLRDAERLARSIPIDLIDSDPHLDVIGGSAGAILGLLKLHRLRPSPEILALVQACADRLCRDQHDHAAYCGAWDSAVASRPLTGFSHGASGMACALAHLHAVTRDPRLLVAADLAAGFERAAFVPAAGNWIDFRLPSASTAPCCATSWCHGAPGIAVARLALRCHQPTPAIAADLEAALATTRDAATQSVDHLCCGNFGRYDILLHAAGVLGRTDLASAAAALANRGRRRPAAFRVFPTDVPEIAGPGFFDGLAGIGYVLLRLAAPDKLPCVLAFE